MNSSNTTSYDNSFFHRDRIIDFIRDFYQHNGINLIFKSIVSYLNYKSYSFTYPKENNFSEIEELVSITLRLLQKRTIRLVGKDNGEVCFEIPNDERQNYDFFTAIESQAFQQPEGMTLPVLLGENSGAVVTDLVKMPHLLVSGSTGAGKSLFIQNLILSLLYHNSPEKLKLVLIDPKVVELSVYNDIPHLLFPVITQKNQAMSALDWCIDEMERRYQLLSRERVLNIVGYNEKVGQENSLPYIVVIIDEFADLIMWYGKNAEERIARLTSKARVVGIHLVIATQRPATDVITDLIKANVPSRIALATACKQDSQTILDTNGAESLMGRGDMLYLANGSSDVVRIQCPFVEDDDIYSIADALCEQGKPTYLDLSEFEFEADEILADPLVNDAFQCIIETGNPSISSILRQLNIGFNRAANIMDYLEYVGVLSQMENGKRKILKTELPK